MSGEVLGWLGVKGYRLDGFGIRRFTAIQDLSLFGIGIGISVGRGKRAQDWVLGAWYEGTT